MSPTKKLDLIQKTLISFFSLIFIVLPLFLITNDALASGSMGYEEYGLGELRFYARDYLLIGSPYHFIAQIINWILGIVGLLLTVVIIYGGWTYMTAAGNEDKARKAKSILTYSIIGITVIFASWIIVNYLISAFGADQGGSCGGEKDVNDWNYMGVENCDIYNDYDSNINEMEGWFGL